MGLAQGRRQQAHGQPCPAPGWEHGPGHDTWPCGFRLPGFVVLFFFFVIFLEETLPGGGGGGLPEVTKPGQALRRCQGKSVSGSECTMGCPGLCG